VITEDSQEDQVWVIVKRTIEGETVRYVEFFKPQEIYSILEDAFFVHSGLSFEGQGEATITNITQADPAVVEAEAHGFTNGELVRIKDVEGMTEVNQGLRDAYTVANKTDDTFELTDFTSEGWGTYESGGTAIQVIRTIDGLDHLEGKEVDILADGAVVPRETVDSDGEITMDWYGNTVHVGLPYTSIIEPMKPSINTQQGTNRGKPQTINKLTLLFYETVGGKFGPDVDNLKKIKFGTGIQPSLFTGDKNVEFSGNYDDGATITIVQDQPLPMTVLGIVPYLTVNEN
jgi:hypothetical protein